MQGRGYLAPIVWLMQKIFCKPLNRVVYWGYNYQYLINITMMIF